MPWEFKLKERNLVDDFSDLFNRDFVGLLRVDDFLNLLSLPLDLGLLFFVDRQAPEVLLVRRFPLKIDLDRDRLAQRSLAGHLAFSRFETSLQVLTGQRKRAKLCNQVGVRAEALGLRDCSLRVV